MNDPFAFAPSIGARVLQAGLDANGSLVGFFLVQTARALFGLLRATRYSMSAGRWVGLLDSEVC